MTLWSQDRFTQAWDFATLAHHGQSYATPDPNVRMDYINHVGAVAMELMWALAAADTEHDPDLALQCALLHDVLEDTPRTYAEVQAVFGTAVADGVQALTKNFELPKADQMADSLARIRQQPPAVWMVKLADRINNLSEPPAHWTDERKRAYQAEAQVIHDQLHTAHPLLAARLRERIAAYGRWLGSASPNTL